MTHRLPVEQTPDYAWRWVRFECQAGPGSQVFVGGTFNGWRPSRFDKLRDRRHDGMFRTLLQLHKGQHAYDFLVDGVWRADPVGAAHRKASVLDVA